MVEYDGRAKAAVMSFSYVVDFVLSKVKLPACHPKLLHYAFKVLYNSNGITLLLKTHLAVNQMINTIQTAYTIVCWVLYSLGEQWYCFLNSRKK